MSDVIDKRALDKDIAKFTKTLDKIARVMDKDKDGLIKQTAIFAIQSAVKLTEPGTTSKVSKLPKKFKFRPLVTIPENFGFFYTDDAGRIFKTREKLRRNQLKDGKLRRVTKGIKTWNKKRKSFLYIPYAGAKRDESDRRFKIPFAGAAKVGWLKSLKMLDRKPVDLGDNKGNKRYNRVINRPGLLEIVNLVSYASKTSPGADRKALAKATSRLEKIWLPKVDRRISRDWKKAGSTFLRGIK
jgi:hypothetical protein